MRTYKDKSMQNTYLVMYNNGPPMYKDSGYRHTGASHRCNYWNGFDGSKNVALPGSIGHACYMAGRDWRKDHPAESEYYVTAPYSGPRAILNSTKS